MAGIHNVMAGRKGASFTPVLRTYFSGTSATETAPAGATQVVIEVWGGGAGGPRGIGTGCTADYNADGSSGGYCRTTLPITGGQTLTYTCGAAGLGRTGSPGTSGGASSVSSGTATVTTMTANGGTFSNLGGGAAGTASGGTDANVTGNVGVYTGSGIGTPGPSGIYDTSGEGYGGFSGLGAAGNGANGGAGTVLFRYS